MSNVTFASELVSPQPPTLNPRDISSWATGLYEEPTTGNRLLITAANPSSSFSHERLNLFVYKNGSYIVCNPNANVDNFAEPRTAWRLVSSTPTITVTP